MCTKFKRFITSGEEGERNAYVILQGGRLIANIHARRRSSDNYFVSPYFFVVFFSKFRQVHDLFPCIECNSYETPLYGCWGKKIDIRSNSSIYDFIFSEFTHTMNHLYRQVVSIGHAVVDRDRDH